MDPEVSMDGLTPRGGKLDGKPKQAVEAAKNEMRGKVSKTLNKLNDRHTQDRAISEFAAICDEPLAPAFVSIIVSSLAAAAADVSENSSFSRAAVARMFGTLANTQFNSLMEADCLQKVVKNLVKRLKDKDTSVRDAIGETFGELACLFIPYMEARSVSTTDVTIDEDAPAPSPGSEEPGPSLGIFFGPLIKAMESAEEHSQQGAAISMAQVVFHAGSAVLSRIPKLSQKIVPILGNSQFRGRAQLLTVVCNMVEVCPDGFSADIARAYVPKLQAVCGSSDWNARKAAMEVIETMANRLDAAILIEHKKDFEEMLTKHKHDKLKPVRDQAIAALAAWRGRHEVHSVQVPLPALQARSPAAEELAASEQENAGSAERQWGDAPLGAIADAPLRTPLQKSTSANRPRAQDPGQLTVEALAKVGSGPAPAPAPPSLRTKWTRRVPHPVLIGHAVSLTPY
jgi:HEAT repeat protein